MKRIKKIMPFRRRWFMLLLIFIVALSVIELVRLISAPVHGHTTHSNQKLPSIHKSVPAPTPASQFQSPFYTLDLPIGYRVQPGSDAVPGLLYQQNIIKQSTTGSLIVAIAVAQGSDLSNNSSYRLRSENPAQYIMTTRTIAGETVQIANDKKSAAVVAFWTHGNKLVTIGVSSGTESPVEDGNIDELAALQPVLTGWQWR